MLKCCKNGKRYVYRYILSGKASWYLTGQWLIPNSVCMLEERENKGLQKVIVFLPF